MALGRPRRWALEDLLKAVAFRASGLSWRATGAQLGTSGSRVYELVKGPRPAARDPDAWELLGGDETLEILFRKCLGCRTGSRAAAAGRRRGRPGAAGRHGTSV